MTRFTVTWPNDLKQELAERWIESSSADRARLVKLNSLVDREPAVNADQRGRLLGDDPTVRVWTIGEARAVFEVNASDRIVRV